MYNNIPAELQALAQWVCWRHEIVEGRQTKVPYSPVTGKHANVNKPASWSTFEDAVAKSTYFDGIGLVLTEADPYTFIDIDNKPSNPASEAELLAQQRILEAFQSYTELSVSGSGYHIIVRGKVPTDSDRGHVGVYSRSRYLTFTGQVVRNAPIIDCQELLNLLYQEMQPIPTVELTDRDAIQSDQEVIEMAMRAANADKFNSLCAGNIEEYQSQSEADFALLSILAFYSPDNEQVRRLFRMSKLGKRDKAIKNDSYLNFALGKIRAQQPAPVDFTQMMENAKRLLAPKPEPSAPSQGHGVPTPPPSEPEPEDEEVNFPAPTSLSLPPGLIGELAKYFYETAIRPVPEIALAAAITLTAGVCGRSFNISGSGLNQYLILLARTGSGKEGALSGIENLISAVRPQIPMVDQFLGPAAFASGQALVKVLNDKPCFVSVLGEFGLTLQQLSDHRASSSQLMLRKVLLDLYAKSGWNRMLRSSVYSDVEKNTNTVQAPNVTILGESTQETFFDGLDASHIAEGLVPRFSVMEYTGKRPPRNRNSNTPPNRDLVQQFADLVTVSLTTSNNNTCSIVQMDAGALELMDSFDTRADRIMNSSLHEVEVQVWNRAHLKALKLAALVAVGCNVHKPIVNAEMARWAIDFVIRDVELVASRYREGDVGQGDSKQYHDLKRTIETYFQNPAKIVRERFDNLHKARLIPYAYLTQRIANVASYRNDKMGATNALKKNLQVMIDSAMLVEVPKVQLMQNHQFSGVAYGISQNWG